jgi:hypothetical protein
MPQSPHLGKMARKRQNLEGFSMRETKEPAIGVWRLLPEPYKDQMEQSKMIEGQSQFTRAGDI